MAIIPLVYGLKHVHVKGPLLQICYVQTFKGARSEVIVSISVDGHQGEASSYGLGVYMYIGCCKSIKTFLCP